jgi:hypothetical protein
MTRAPKPWTAYGRYGSVGIELVASILLGWYVGHWADERWFHGHGWLTAIGFLVGVYAGFRALFLTASRMQADVERAERQERGEDPWSRSSSAPTTPRAHPESARDDDERPPHDDA